MIKNFLKKKNKKVAINSNTSKNFLWSMKSTQKKLKYLSHAWLLNWMFYICTLFKFNASPITRLLNSFIFKWNSIWPACSWHKIIHEKIAVSVKWSLDCSHMSLATHLNLTIKWKENKLNLKTGSSYMQYNFSFLWSYDLFYWFE